jgi:ribosomal protein S13
LYKNISFFSISKIKKSGLNYVNSQNLYKILGLPIRYGKLTSKEIFFFKKINIDNFYKRTTNIAKIGEIGTLKSAKHTKNYPTNGQRTRTNGKTRKIYKRI